MTATGFMALFYGALFLMFLGFWVKADRDFKTSFRDMCETAGGTLEQSGTFCRWKTEEPHQ